MSESKKIRSLEELFIEILTGRKPSKEVGEKLEQIVDLLRGFDGRLQSMETNQQTTGTALGGLRDAVTELKTELETALGVTSADAELEQLAERLKKSGDDLGAAVEANQP